MVCVYVGAPTWFPVEPVHGDGCPGCGWPLHSWDILHMPPAYIWLEQNPKGRGGGVRPVWASLRLVFSPPEWRASPP